MKELSIEEKKLLFEDLSARLSYGVYIEHITTKIRGKLKGMIFNHIYNDTDSVQDINAWVKFYGDEYVDATYFRPILRPMSSMTEEEENECIGFSRTIIIPHVRNWFNFSITNPVFTDWLNAHHFDYRCLIEKGLALEAPKEMYI